jgi:hypothetical protein
VLTPCFVQEIGYECSYTTWRNVKLQAVKTKQNLDINKDPKTVAFLYTVVKAQKAVSQCFHSPSPQFCAEDTAHCDKCLSLQGD